MYTAARRAGDRALQSLPITQVRRVWHARRWPGRRARAHAQHERIWALTMELVSKTGIVAVAVKLWPVGHACTCA